MVKELRSLIPALAPGVRLNRDMVRHQWTLLCPDGVVFLNSTGAAILLQCDGVRNIEQISESLAASFHSSKSSIEEELHDYLQSMRVRKLVELRAVPEREDASNE